MRRLHILKVIAVAAVVVAVISALVVLTTSVRDDTNGLRLDHQFIVQSCQRLNILRVEDNVSHFADYRVFRVVAQEARMAPLLPGGTPEQDKFRAAFLDQISEAVQQKTWVPRTDCSKAINDRGTRFRAPRPVRFADRLPPKIDLRLDRDDFENAAAVAP